MRLGRISMVAIAAGTSALVLSGCLVLQGAPKLKQVDQKPKVKLAFSICESGGPDCPDQGNTQSDSGGGEWQVLIGLRVPKGSKPPQSFKAKSVAGTAGATPPAAATLTRHADFKRQLNQTAPKGKKFKWFGYISDPVEGNGEQSADFKVKIEVPKKLVGKKFKAAPTVGFVNPDAEGEPDCGDDPFSTQPFTQCIDSPSREDLKNIKVKVEEKKSD